MDSNGYNESILQAHPFCLYCGGDGELVRHEIFAGVSRRSKSKALGLWCWLHPKCHEAVHAQGGNFYKREAQAIAMAKYGWSKEEFINEMGRNYL